MLRELILPEQQIRFEEKRVATLGETVQTIKETALERARTMLPPRDRQSDLEILLANRDFVDYFNYHLSIEIAKIIGSHDQRVQSIHRFEESTNPDAQTEEYPRHRDLTLHLLAVVTSSSAALEAFINSLDRTLTATLNAMPSEAFAGRTSFLNVLAITEEDIEARRGYAVLLSSIYARPVTIWQRA